MFLKGMVIAMITAFAITGAVDAAKKPEVIAHRGASFVAPENTMASYNLAWKLNADAVEIDIYLTKDQQIIISHDSNTKRVSGVDMNIPNSNFNDLRTLDAGKWKAPQYTGEKLPSLSEALASIPRGKRMFIEIKCGPEIIPFFLNDLKASRKSSKQIVVISFSSDVIKEIKRAKPELKAYWLCGATPDNADQVIATTKQINADGVDINPGSALDAAYMKKLRDAKLGVYVWTIDDESAGKHLADLGVDGITTNKPEQMRKCLGK